MYAEEAKQFVVFPQEKPLFAEIQNVCQRGTALIPRHCWIDLIRPRVDAAGYGLACVEALLAQPVGYAQRARSVVAEDEQAIVGVELLVGARGYISHGHEQAAVNLGGCEFPGLTHVDQFALPSCNNVAASWAVIS
jgi:hypothetical protein